MPDTIELRVNQLGKDAIVRSLNHSLRAHWAQNKRVQKKYELFIRNQMSLKRIRKAITGEPFALHIISYRKRLLDHDNLYGAHKWLIDALCNELFIFEDDPKHCKITIDQYSVKKQSDRSYPATVITRSVYH